MWKIIPGCDFWDRNAFSKQTENMTACIYIPTIIQQKRKNFVAYYRLLLLSISKINNFNVTESVTNGNILRNTFALRHIMLKQLIHILFQ